MCKSCGISVKRALFCCAACVVVIARYYTECVSLCEPPSIVSFDMSNVAQQKLQVLLFFFFFLPCPVPKHSTHCQQSPVHSDHLLQACLGFPQQFVHKLWLPFGLPIKVTGRGLSQFLNAKGQCLDMAQFQSDFARDV